MDDLIKEVLEDFPVLTQEKEHVETAAGYPCISPETTPASPKSEQRSNREKSVSRGGGNNLVAVPVLAETAPQSVADPVYRGDTRQGVEARESNRVRPDIPMAASQPVKAFEPLKTDSRGGDLHTIAAPDGDNGLNNQSGSFSLGPTLDKIVAFLERFVNFPKEGQAIVCAIWASHTHVYDRFRFTPYLHIFSPEKRCGKSNLLDTLAMIVARPWKVENLSEASLFHKADKDKSTMLWDEVDNVFKDDQRYAPIIGLLNGGFKRGGRAARCPKGIFTEYDVYCPKVITGIGKIPDTLHDRCIDIKLARAKPNAPFREEDAEVEAAVIRKELEDFATKLGPNDHKVEVEFPGEYIDNGRMCDITEPLLILATQAGPEWLEKVHESLADLCSDIDDMSVSIQLLKDCREIFLNRNVSKIFSGTLINDLIEVEDANSPWPVWWEGDMKFGKTRGPAKKLATLLEGYGIKPHTLRIGNEQSKGYVKEDFADAWSRYLPEPGKMVTRELDLEL